MDTIRSDATDAEYVEFTEGFAHRTVWVDDVIAVNIDKDDVIVGVEFPMGREYVRHDDWLRLFEVCPDLKEAFPNVL